jgi:hypothetical protein
MTNQILLPNTPIDDDTGFIAELNHKGDIKYTWNRKKPEEVAAAKAHFESMRAKGFLVFKVSALGRKGKPVTGDFPKTVGALMYQGNAELAQTFESSANYIATPMAVGG